ncbi:MAG: hypothetical protein GY856_25755, partial [bacterium]|nr:hypothetical protein [bacterium]
MSHRESRKEPGRLPIRALSILAAILLASCATMKPGIGDIAFRLRWQGSADLDLHVEDPDGGHVSFFTAHSDVL